MKVVHTDLLDLKQNLTNLEKANEQFEERLHHIESFSRANFEEPHIGHNSEKGSTIRIPKIKIELERVRSARWKGFREFKMSI